MRDKHQKSNMFFKAKNRKSTVSLALAIAMGLPMVAQANDSEEVKKLQQQVEELSRAVAKMDQAPRVKTKGGGLEVESKDGNKSFEMGGRFQLDYNRFDGAYNAKNDGATASDLFPRRIRTYVEGQADNWDYKLLLDFSEDKGEITLARLRYKGFENGPTIKLGKIREDISLEALTSSKHITAISRPMVANVMSPYFKYGTSAYQYFESTGLRYAIGAYKGGSFGTDGQDENGDMNLSVTGRLTWSPIHTKGKTLHFGAWGSQRDMGGDVLSENFARGEVRNTNVRLVNYAAGGETFSVDNMTQYGFEFAGVYGPLSLQGEYSVRDVNAMESFNDSSYDGYYVTASYFLTGESRVYKKRGVFNSPTPIADSGAWEVFARISQFDATSDTQGTVTEVLTVGTTYYLNKKIKFMANYLISDVSGPGAEELVGEITDGNALTARVQYLF
ncbi:porin [Colwellia sp.]|uniref:OprO/OprP family phosphate-selective porin n=1 Tax=Colwellia sp. TaxID=56799 RepID=UPI0025BE3FF9|nr:porin [Colwellia sp.]